MSNKDIQSEFYVKGMHCAACQVLIEDKLESLETIKNVKAKLNDGKVYIVSSKPLKAAELSHLVESEGYEITTKKPEQTQVPLDEIVKAFVIAGLIFLIFLSLQYFGLIDLLNTDKVNLPFVFLIGVVASLSTCMAVVGGLVISISSTFAKSNSHAPILLFHLSRLIGFFLLGGLIGFIGSAFVLTSTISFILSTILFLVMLIMGLNLLDVFSFTHSLQPRMPKVFGHKILNLMNLQDRKYNAGILMPLFLGAITFFLPCGFTQSMQVYSLTTGSFVKSALVMFTFALGTLPVLGLISFSSIRISTGPKAGFFFKTAGFLVIFFALFNFYSALKVIGLIG